MGIIGVAIVVLGLWELLLRVFDVPSFVFPTHSAIILALRYSMVNLFPHFLYTLGELAGGYAIGASVGLVLAALITQIPFLEKIIAPYIILLIATPTLALVPLLMLTMGFNILPRLIAVAIATGPMVMMNSTTGFRRTDLAKIALARSYGATTFQIFIKIRVFLALPMILVGLLMGGIFGLITAIGADMIGGKIGLGNRLSLYSSIARMPEFFGGILMVAIIGVLIWVTISILSNKYASWNE